MTAERTIRSVPDLSRREEVGEVSEVKQEGNLLIEAVSLLVQRQRETETWVSEQLWQAEQRAADSERRYAELEQRMAGIEAHLAQLVHEVEPEVEPGVDDGRLARLREQIQNLRGAPIRATDDVTRPIAAAPVEPIAADRAPRSARAADVSNPISPLPEVRAEPASPQPRLSRGATLTASASAAPANVGFWELLGSTPEDRFGIVLIGLGAIAVLYALLSQLRFG